MTDTPLDVLFDRPGLPERLRWFNEPPAWRIDPSRGVLELHPRAGTDFWQRTHYGFEADHGHLLHLEAHGDFVLETRVTSHPRHQYDQAGLMLRLSPGCWIKTSVEFEPEGPNRLGAVVTNARWSDWSTQSLDAAVHTVAFRLRLEGSDCIVDVQYDDRGWQQVRMAHLQERDKATSLACGLYACSPRGEGYRAEFHGLSFRPGRVG